jgi:hypothetical protein
VHPALLKGVHAVQLHRALRWLSDWGGALQGLAPASFTPATRALSGVQAEGGDVTARFENGTVALHLLFVEDQLVHLEVKDELRMGELGAHLAAAPRDTETQDRFSETGKDFWARALMGAEAQAFAMLHPGLQRALPGPEVLRPGPGVPANDGVQEVAYRGARVDPEHPGKLHLLYRVRGAEAEVSAHLTLQFTGLQVHLVGFQLPSQLPPLPPLAGVPGGAP